MHTSMQLPSWTAKLVIAAVLVLAAVFGYLISDATGVFAPGVKECCCPGC